MFKEKLMFQIFLTPEITNLSINTSLISFANLVSFVSPKFNYRWGGPLPQSWLDQQLLLQKKILARMYEFGMNPGTVIFDFLLNVKFLNSQNVSLLKFDLYHSPSGLLW